MRLNQKLVAPPQKILAVSAAVVKEEDLYQKLGKAFAVSAASEVHQNFVAPPQIAVACAKDLPFCCHYHAAAAAVEAQGQE